MSVLEQIRSKSGLAIGVVGFALLLFVVSDALNTNFGIFGGNAANSSVGEVDGEKIDIKYFENRLDNEEALYKQRTQQQNIDQNAQDMLREQTWNQIIQEMMMNKEYEDLGITVTNDELFEMVQGEDPHPQIKSATVFQNPQTGQFDRTLVVRYLKQLMESNQDDAKAQWAVFEEGLVKEAVSKKYATLLRKGVYATSLEGKARMNDRLRTVDLDVVPLSFYSIPDTAVTAEEGDVKSYFSKNKDKYKARENSRKMDFVLFDVYPTQADSQAVEKWAQDQVAQFAAAENDTLYVEINSDSKFDTVAHPLSYYPVEIADRIFNDPVGSVIGPVFKDGKFRVYKVSGVKMDSVYYMRASHILFRTEGPTKEDTLNTMKKAQEVLAEIRKGGSFEEKAAQYGTDGTASRGGDLGWFREGAMVKEFGDYVKAHDKGEMGIVKTQFGIHIVKVTENKTKKLVSAGVVERALEPSEQTSNTVYTQASQFAASLTEDADFDQLVAEKGLTKRVADNMKEGDKSIAGFPDAREVIRWSFNAKKDDVSDVFTVGDKYIVARLTGISEKGKADFDNVKEDVKADYIQEKKAEKLMEKAQASMTGTTGIQDYAKKVQANPYPLMNQSFDNANVPMVGPDNIFIGTVFGKQVAGKMLGPVKGDKAIYVYQIKKFNDPREGPIMNFQDEIRNQLAQKVEYGAYDVLKELNNVKDNRYKFY